MAKLNSKNRKKNMFTKKKSMVGSTPRGVQLFSHRGSHNNSICYSRAKATVVCCPLLLCYNPKTPRSFLNYNFLPNRAIIEIDFFLTEIILCFILSFGGFLLFSIETIQSDVILLQK